MNTKPLLRKASMEDINAIAQVYLRSRKELVAFAPLIHSDESIHQWVRETLLPEEQVIVAEDKGMIVGMMSLKKDKEFGKVTQLYIQPDRVSHGIGTLLLNKAKALLGSPIRLYTFEQNSDARRFYERHGFKAISFDNGCGNEENCPAVLYEWAD